MCISDSWTGYELVTQFIEYSPVVTTNNYNTLKITVTVTHVNNVFNTSTIESSILHPQSSGTVSLELHEWIHPWSGLLYAPRLG
jgi:hypothetical protein